ncbi:hypothetical protein M2281_000953 [Mesorhizobium soli]|uniref:DUF1254 domain-containing protein n=1 Tax=Pseudaminobacter soli (ex Li et al. 2025) TaxID=1295366 RepID=UPI0024738E69|nr:DUF1254 domain-containing protein [Mesorhizobium soli]MDH6230381.1 hypothetical protein [Mesorhizobium soli]
MFVLRQVALGLFALGVAGTSVAAQDFSADELNKRAIERRAVEAVIWGMPAVNYDLMLEAMIRDAKGAPNQVLYWSRLPDWKNQTLTPNPDTTYFMPFIDTRDVGPVVIEIPPADGGLITGSIMDGWQTALEDVGPAGLDKGKGGKYLVLPPAYGGDVPPGYILLPSSTYQSYALLRSNLRGGSEADVAKAVEYGKRIKVYPLSKADNPPETKFVDAADIVFDSTIPYDLRFYQALGRFIDANPWLPRDKAMIDQLKTIGIEKGKPFNPDGSTQDILNKAAGEAHAWLDEKYEGLFQPLFKGSRWALPASPEVVEGMQSNFSKADSYPIDGRGATYSMAFFSAKNLGEGQFYLMTIKDKDGNAFDGDATYRLTVPPKAPVKQYWSVTAYDRANHALIRDVPRPSRSSQSTDLVKNADGSVDIWFGPKAPEGKENNWIPTKPGGKFEVLFRLYGPEKSFFDKKWVLPDIEKVG